MIKISDPRMITLLLRRGATLTLAQCLCLVGGVVLALSPGGALLPSSEREAGLGSDTWDTFT
ncbi:hypothetical protein EYF80_064994 [Liparis tanakae]|uniref:Uncharacterized protein n=1 Tax=Liparis tanakae TaxID=230148 RepID=A0A4Z2E7Z6_9TELE|nr:hypothetical protein EYF80_064994 [Liparis tanakae]